MNHGKFMIEGAPERRDDENAEASAKDKGIFDLETWFAI